MNRRQLLKITPLIPLAGCASLREDPLKQAAVGIAFRHGVDAYINKGDTRDRSERVLRYISIVESLEDQLTINNLSDVLIAALPRDRMLPGDYQDANLIIQAVAQSIVDQTDAIPDGERIREILVSAQYFIDIARSTAEIYV